METPPKSGCNLLMSLLNTRPNCSPNWDTMKNYKIPVNSRWEEPNFNGKFLDADVIIKRWLFSLHWWNQ